MRQNRTQTAGPSLQELPLLPGQAEGLARAGFLDAAQLLRHPLVQQGINRLLAGGEGGWDREVLDLPLAAFLEGPGVALLEEKGCHDLGSLLALPPGEELAQVQWHPERLLQALGLPHAGEEPPARDQLPIENVAPSHRALRACRQLGIQTLRDFLATSRSRFLSVPGVGARTWRDLKQAVVGILTPKAEGAAGLETPLHHILASRRARKAFQQLGLVTVADFLRTPREEFLKLRNFGERSWFEVSGRIQGVLGRGGEPHPALPPALKNLRLDFLALPRRPRAALKELGLTTLGELLATPPLLLSSHRNFGEGSWRRLLAALDEALRQGLDQVAGPPPEELKDLDELRQILRTKAGEARLEFVLAARTGLEGRRRLTLQELAERLSLSRERARQLAGQVRDVLSRRAAPYLERLRDEGEALLFRGGGVLRPKELARLPLAGGRGPAEPRVRTVLGLLLFFFPDRFHRLSTGALTSAPPGAVRRLQRALRRSLRPERLPQPMARLAAALAAAGLDPAAYQGLARHLACRRFGVKAGQDDSGQAVLLPAGCPAADRLAGLLAEAPGGLPVEELQVLHAARFGPASRRRLTQVLRREPRFARTGANLWDLAARHPLDRERRGDLAARALSRLQAERRPLPAAELVPGAEPWELLRALAGNPDFRNLGRERITWAGAGGERPSWVEERVHRLLEEAGGPLPPAELEVAAAREDGPAPATVRAFVQNSRSLALWADGRVGLVEAHPFGPAARTEAMELLQELLVRRGGHARLSSLQAEGAERMARLAQLSPAVLADAMARDGRFAFFGREFVAAGEATLQWLQERILAVLREAREPLGPPLILAACPELAEFEDSLEEILQACPMVAVRPDGSYGLLR